MNIKLKIKNALILMTLSVTFFSCENNVEEDSITVEVEVCSPDVSFATSIKSIIDANCINCHGGNRFPDLRTYQGIRNSAAIVKTQVVNRTMPQGGSLSNDQIALIRCWVENGALNN